jgi:alginate O-acetyltransferase complex protein AlgI
MFDIDIGKLLQQLVYDEKNPLMFNSGFFFYFFTIFLLFYLLIHKHKLTRVIVFTVFSLYFFYKACGWYVGFILIAAVFDFNLSNAIWKANTQLRKNALLVFSILTNLGLLFYFKYTNFFIEIVNEIGAGQLDPLKLALPVGISFYTFENLSYTIDVYRGHFKPVSSFWDYCFFLSFFPKLMMGPIVRAADFIPQIRQDIRVTQEDVGAGLYLILSGLFRKVVISDFIWLNYGQYIFDDPSKHSGVECLLGVYCYALRIYCDFSGYSDMAIGMARWMGFKIPANFRSPYQSANITEFWRRWHISLSTWLRDYLYIPLGGNRKVVIGAAITGSLFFGGAAVWTGIEFVQKQHVWPLVVLLCVLALLVVPALVTRKRESFAASLNQLLTMLIGGLWHGASWNFLFWGFLHGVALGLDKLRLKILPVSSNPVRRFLGVLLTFHIVCFAWIFFVCEDFAQASAVITQITGNFAPETFVATLTGYWPVMVVMAIGFILHFVPERVEEKVQLMLGRWPSYGRVLLLIGFIWMVIQMKQAEQLLPIYLQF